jgi:hypothetical protein
LFFALLLLLFPELQLLHACSVRSAGGGSWSNKKVLLLLVRTCSTEANNSVCGISSRVVHVVMFVRNVFIRLILCFCTVVAAKLLLLLVLLLLYISCCTVALGN